MVVSLKHNFTSAVVDSGDATLVQPSNWNEEHNLTLDSGNVLGRTSTGNGAVEEISYAALAAAAGYVTLTGTETLTNKTFGDDTVIDGELTVYGNAGPNALFNLGGYASGGGGGGQLYAWLRNWVGTDAYSEGYYVETARGTFASPAAIQTGDVINGIVFGGYDGTNANRFQASIYGKIDGAVGTTVVPMSLEFATGVAVGGGTTRMTIASDGLVTIGNYAFNNTETVGAGQDNYVLTYDHATGLIGLENALAPYLTSASAASAYQPVGDYVGSASLVTTLATYVTSASVATSLAAYLTSASAASAYQPAGDYVGSASLQTTLATYVTSASLGTALATYVTSASVATSLAAYLTSASAASAYQPVGDYVGSASLVTTLATYVTSVSLGTALAPYLTSGSAATAYQAAGDYVTSGSISTMIAAQVSGADHVTSASLATALSPYLTSASAAAAYVTPTGTATFTNKTITSAAFSGTHTGNFALANDLIVDTNTLYVSAANNTVALGATTAQNVVNKLEVTGNLARIVARPSANTSWAGLEAQATDYWSSTTFRGTTILQHDSASTGTTGSLSNSSLGVLRFQNCSNAMIYTNGSFPLIFATTNIERMRISGAGDVTIANNLVTTPTTVGSLPAAGAAGAGARRFVTDANATTFASVVAGGGSNGVPVYSDGTNWRIG